MAKAKTKKKSNAGRPTKYKPEHCQGIIKFFSVDPIKTLKETYTYKDGTTKEKEIEVPCEIPLLSDYAVSIGVSRDTLHEWQKTHKEFSDSYKIAKEIQRGILIKLAMKGLYNPGFSIFAAKNMIGWRDKKEVDATITNIEDIINAISG